MKTVAEYRQFAEDCRKLAASLTIPADKQALELMAIAWDKVAAAQKQVSKGPASRTRIGRRKAWGDFSTVEGTG